MMQGTGVDFWKGVTRPGMVHGRDAEHSKPTSRFQPLSRLKQVRSELPSDNGSLGQLHINPKEIPHGDKATLYLVQQYPPEFLSEIFFCSLRWQKGKNHQ